MKGEESKQNLCQICRESPFKYRCPSCYLLYCSLPCFKSHKESICALETEKRINKNVHIGHQKEKNGEDDDYSEDEDRLSSSDLEKLENCTVIKNMLRNKDIRKLITNIDGAQDPDTTLKSYMQEPIFLEFVDQCLSIVKPKKENNS